MIVCDLRRYDSTNGVKPLLQLPQQLDKRLHLPWKLTVLHSPTVRHDLQNAKSEIQVMFIAWFGTMSSCTAPCPVCMQCVWTSAVDHAPCKMRKNPFVPAKPPDTLRLTSAVSPNPRGLTSRTRSLDIRMFCWHFVSIWEHCGARRCRF